MSSKSTSSHKRQRISEESKTEGQTWVLPVDGSKHNSKAFEWVAYVEVLATLETSEPCVCGSPMRGHVERRGRGVLLVWSHCW